MKPPSPPVVGGIPAHHSGETNHPPTRVVIHSAVMPCEVGRARLLGDMNRRGSTSGSWHYATDPAETIQCSYDRFVCWHAPPNAHSIGIEMADTPQRWQRGLVWRWRGLHHRKMLERTARLTAHLCLAYDLPLVWLRPKDLRAGHKGITSHANVTRAFGQSTHWDPGWWPRRHFMRMVRAEAKELVRAESQDVRG